MNGTPGPDAEQPNVEELRFIDGLCWWDGASGEEVAVDPGGRYWKLDRGMLPICAPRRWQLIKHPE